jgi:hypothetical protein
MQADIYKATQEIVEWCNSVFPQRTPDKVLDKLLEEIEELRERPCDGHELADVMILLLDYCDMVGVDILKVMHWKMEINKKRRWWIDERGILQHEDPDEGAVREALAHGEYGNHADIGGAPMGSSGNRKTSVRRDEACRWVDLRDCDDSFDP